MIQPLLNKGRRQPTFEDRKEKFFLGFGRKKFFGKFRHSELKGKTDEVPTGEKKPQSRPKRKRGGFTSAKNFLVEQVKVARKGGGPSSRWGQTSQGGGTGEAHYLGKRRGGISHNNKIIIHTLGEFSRFQTQKRGERRGGKTYHR